MYLLDTHTLLWWVEDNKALSQRVAGILANHENKIYCSAASVWEIAIKAKINKLSIPLAPLPFISKIISTYSFFPLPISIAHACAIYNLPPVHNDPFDRLLVAQAREEKFTLLTNDPEIAKYEVGVVW